SRRRHTRFSRDWSSDVCSSDLGRDRADGGEKRQAGFDHVHFALKAGAHGAARAVEQRAGIADAALAQLLVLAHAAGKNAFHGARSEERRVGNEWLARWAAEPQS